MEQKVGITLCTRGTATRIVGSRLCRVECGMATVVTPMLPTVEVERSEDYEECIIVEDAECIMGETAAFFPRIMPVVSTSLPCIKLDEALACRIVDAAHRIADRESRQPANVVFRQMNDRLISLQRVQTILEVLYEMASAGRLVEEKASHGEQVFVDFMRSLSQHYAERRLVADYAAEAALSVRHFSSLIQQHTGQTPMQWIHIFIIGQAKHLLLQRDLQVKEIADQLGFPEQFTFRKYFKTHTGVSPTDYRKSLFGA